MDQSEFYLHDMTFTKTGGTAIGPFDVFLASDLYTSGSDAVRPDLREGTTCANNRQIIYGSLPISTHHQSGGGLSSGTRSGRATYSTLLTRRPAWITAPQSNGKS